jgi:Meiotically Up-regulated Gene 113 (MUG113) protein
MLAMADRNGIIAASIPGLADMARTTIEETKAALQKFMEPDEYSRSKEDDGKRIREIDGGWILINHAKYRDDPGDRCVPASEKPGKIYFIRCGDCIKIGFSKNPWARLATLKTGMPENPVMLGHFSGMLEQETELHDRFKSYRLNREWFKATPKLLDYIKSVVTGSDGSSATTDYNNTKAKADPLLNTGFAVPACFEKIEGFTAALAGWIEHRKKIKKPVTGLAIQELLNKLSERPDQSVSALKTAVLNGWQGFKWEWIDNHNSNGTSRQNTRINPRVVGTANEGMCDQYAGIGRITGTGQNNGSTDQ